MNTYELTYIIPIKTDGEDVTSIQSKIEAVLIDSKAKKIDINNEFTVVRKKKLCYEINKIQHGYYVTVYFEASSDSLEIISNALKKDENVLRFLIIAVKGEIPQGTVVSKKEVEQQIDDAVENATKAAEENTEDKKKESKKPKINKISKDNKDEKSSQKASLEKIDEKLDEILSDK